MDEQTTASTDQSQGKWYLVNTYSGREESVRKSIEQRVKTMDMGHKIFEVILPTEEEFEYKSGERRKVTRKMYPGYLMVKMVMEEATWFTVRNTPGVMGFISAEGETGSRHAKPIPLDDEEVERVMARMNSNVPRVRLGYNVGEVVRIKEGPFADFMGNVTEVDEERGKVRIQISLFGRETPVEIDFLQLEKV